MSNPAANIDTEDSAPPFFGGSEHNPDPGGPPRRDPISLSLKTSASPSLPEQWLALHGDALFRYALMLTADEHRAEDLVQETLLAALKSHAQFAAAASQRTWLISILRNKAIDQRRRDQLHDQYLADLDPAVEGNFNRFGKWRSPPTHWTPNAHSLLESQEFWTIFHDCMRAIPLHMREVFALRMIEGLEASETCRLLDITSANLWTILSRARERLRRCLDGKWSIKEKS